MSHCSFQSKAVRSAAANRRVSIPEARRIVTTYQVSGTIDAEEGRKIERDVDLLEAGCKKVKISPTALGILRDSIPGVQLMDAFVG